MSSQQNREDRGDLVTIARDASFVDWLLTRSQPRRQPPALPAKLRADLGLSTVSLECGWHSYR